MRREWIEILVLSTLMVRLKMSPSMRREWIEIGSSAGIAFPGKSPSMRREWIEIRFAAGLPFSCESGLPPCGGSGLKCRNRVALRKVDQSPSMRREWIEILNYVTAGSTWFRLPPCGGSGLKSASSPSIDFSTCLPPCGGSGLKFNAVIHSVTLYRSPSMRREWIEMYLLISGSQVLPVSLHAEGVD